MMKHDYKHDKLMIISMIDDDKHDTLYMMISMIEDEDDMIQDHVISGSS